MIKTITPSPTTLIMRHTFDAPRERVFDAWITPEVMRLFLVGDDTQCVDVAVDARVGGAFKVTLNHAEMGELVAFGTYRDITRPQRIQCTWTWEEDDKADEHETLLTLEFKDLGAQTELTLTHEHLRNEQSRDNHRGGWTSMLEHLDALLRETTK